jgi:hypothetical protein
MLSTIERGESREEQSLQFGHNPGTINGFRTAQCGLYGALIDRKNIDFVRLTLCREAGSNPHEG